MLSFVRAFVAFLMLAAATLAADPARYNIGDRVEASVSEKWLPGTVMSVDPDGSVVMVQLDDDPSVPTSMSDTDRQMMLQRRIEVGKVRLTGAAASRSTSANTPSSPALFPGARMWSDKSGKFSVAAIYRGIEAGKVSLEKSDGKRIAVPLERLSASDQQFVSDQQAPASTASDDDPFALAAGSKPTPGRTITIPPTTQATPAAPTAPMTPTARSNTPAPPQRLSKNGPLFFGKSRQGGGKMAGGAKTLSPREFDAWSYQPTPAASLGAPVSLRAASLSFTPLPDSDAFFEKVQAIRVSTDRSTLWVARQSGSVGREATAYVEEFDIAAGRSLAIYELPRGTMIADIEPDARLVAYGETKHGHDFDSPQLTIAMMGEQGLETVHELNLQADDDGRHMDSGYDGVEFLGNNGLLVKPSFFAEVVSLWDISTGKQTLQIPVGHMRDGLCTSDDGSLLAIPMQDGVALIDLRQGEHVATVPAKTLGGFSKVAISPDNLRMAVPGTDGLEIWDLSTGALVTTVRHPIATFNRDIEWSGAFLLVDGTYLFDIDRGILLWEYSEGFGHSEFTDIRRGVLLSYQRSMGQGQPSVIVAPVPDTKVVHFAESLPPLEKLIALRPGDSVKLDVDIDETLAPAAIIHGQLVDHLLTIGLNVDDDAKIVVRAVCKSMPPQQIALGPWPPPSFRDYRPDEVTTHTITPTVTSLTVEQGRKVMYRVSNMGMPGSIIHMQDGETRDQALARLTKPNPEMLSEIKIPLPLVKQGDATPNGAYGTSSLLGRKAGRGARFE